MEAPLLDDYSSGEDEVARRGEPGSQDTTSKTIPRRNIIRKVCIYILVMELAERLCFYTFMGSMIIFLRDYLGYNQARVAKAYELIL